MNLMSAYICNPTHIATCAKIVINEKAAPSLILHQADIAEKLGRENVASVAWRYGSEGTATYAEMMAKFLNGISALQTRPSMDDGGLPGMVESVSVPEYLFRCRSFAPIEYTPAEGYMYLACLSYQSCEHPRWKDTQANKWITSAMQALAYAMANDKLGHRRVWEVDDAELAPLPLNP